MTAPSMDLNLLRVFEAVFDEGSVTRAAERLGLSQPAVSGALNRLSRQVGEPLFRRARGGVEPTPRAQRLIGAVRVSLHAMTNTLSAAEGMPAPDHSRRLRIGMFNLAEPVVLPAVLRAIEEEGLNLVLDIVSLYALEGPDDLLAGTLDLIFNLHPIEHEEIVSQGLGSSTFVCIARKGWSESFGPLTEETFAKARFVALSRPNPMSTSKIFAELMRRIPASQFQFSVTRGWSVPNLVAIGDMIAVVPRSFAHIAAPRFGLEIHPLPFDAVRPSIYLSWHKRANDDALHARLRALILQSVQQAAARLAAQLDAETGRDVPPVRARPPRK